METKDIQQRITFKTTPLDLYKCFLDARIHSSFTGAEAVIEEKENTSFTAYDGYITGKNIALERGKKIVQQWKANENNWPENHYSEVVFIFSELPEGCELKFYHTAIPEPVAEKIEKGWYEYYWEPLQIYIER